METARPLTPRITDTFTPTWMRSAMPPTTKSPDGWLRAALLMATIAGCAASHEQPPACESHDDCRVVIVDDRCCSRPMAVRPHRQVAAEHEVTATARREAECSGNNIGCETIGYPDIPVRYFAECTEGACNLVDLHEDVASACSVDTDCRVRAVDCCGCGIGDSPSLGQMIGVSGDTSHLPLCVNDEACDCELASNDGFEVSCDEGHCQPYTCNDVLGRDGRCPELADTSEQ